MSNEIVVPGGMLVDLDDPRSVAQGIGLVRDIEGQLRLLKQQLVALLEEETVRQGTKTLTFEDGSRAIIGGGSKREIDAHAVEQGLRALGMPEERISQIVQIDMRYSVAAREADKAARANPEYARVIEAATRVVDAPVTVKVEAAR
jgi:hypothetical protein